MKYLVVEDTTSTNINHKLTPNKHSREKVLIESSDKDNDHHKNNNNQTQMNIQHTIPPAINTTNL